MPTIQNLEKKRKFIVPTHQPREIRPYEYWAKVERVVDGDTVDLLVSLGFELEMRIRVRLLGVDTPEIHNVRHDSAEYKAGTEAKNFVSQILPKGRWVEIKVYSGPREKYGRWIGEIFVDGRSLNEQLLEKGYSTAV